MKVTKITIIIFLINLLFSVLTQIFITDNLYSYSLFVILLIATIISTILSYIVIIEE